MWDFLKKNRKTIFYLLLVLFPCIFILLFTNQVYDHIASLKNRVDTNIAAITQLKSNSVNIIISNYVARTSIQNEYTTEYILYGLASSNKEEFNEFLKSKDYTMYNTIDSNKNYVLVYKFNNTDSVLFIANDDGIKTLNSTFIPSVNFKFTTMAIITPKTPLITPEDKVRLLKKNLNIVNKKFYYNDSESALGKFNVKLDTIDDLKNYNILVPTFVSINNGKTYDFMIVREIQMYSLVTPYSYDLSYYTDITDSYRTETNRLMFIIVALASIIDIALVLSIITAAIKANKSISSTTETNNTASRKDKK